MKSIFLAGLTSVFILSFSFAEAFNIGRSPASSPNYGIGLDFGTSSAKLCIADDSSQRHIIYSDSYPWSTLKGKQTKMNCV